MKISRQISGSNFAIKKVVVVAVAVAVAVVVVVVVVVVVWVVPTLSENTHPTKLARLTWPARLSRLTWFTWLDQDGCTQGSADVQNHEY